MFGDRQRKTTIKQYTAFLPYRGFYDIAVSCAISNKIGRHFEKLSAAIP